MPLERQAPPTSAEIAERFDAAQTELADAERTLADAQAVVAVEPAKDTLADEAKAKTAHAAALLAVERLTAALDATTRREARDAQLARLASLRMEDLQLTEALDKADKAARALDKALEAYAGAVIAYTEAASTVQRQVAAIGGRARQDHALPILSRELPRQLARATRGAFALPGAASLVSNDVTAIKPLAVDVLSHTASWRTNIEAAAAAREGRTAPPAEPAPDAPPIPASALAAHASATAAPSEARTW